MSELGMSGGLAAGCYNDIIITQVQLLVWELHRRASEGMCSLRDATNPLTLEATGPTVGQEKELR